MLRILRAFAWMRWRVLLNSLERTGARDTLERLSLAVEQLGPLLAAALLVPSAAALGGLAAYAGYALAPGTTTPLAFELLRYMLLAATAFSVAGPFMLPGGDRPGAVRLLLLPVPRRVLYVAQTAGSIAEPWILLTVPIAAGLPAGLAAAGRIAAAGIALAAGVAFVLVLLGLSSLTTLLLQLAVRKRRRGELIGLLFILALPLLAILPGLADAGQRRAQRGDGIPPDTHATIPAWLQHAGPRAFALLPSELHVDATRTAAGAGGPGVLSPIAALTATAGVLHALSLFAFGRFLDSPFTTGTRRAAAPVRRWQRRIPGLSPGASAVAVVQVRTALRTPRGRSVVLSPVIVSAVFGFLLLRSGDMEIGPLALSSGLGLATFGGAVCLLSIQPLAMNQFAIDRAGLTLTLLTPLPASDLLIGKLVGNGLVAALPALICVVGSFALLPGGPLTLWLALVPALASTYLLAAPAAAALSATFPRTVDLNSIGSRSNAHGLAGLLGLLAFGVAGIPSIALTLAATHLVERPNLVPWLALAWCLVSLAACRLLLIPARVLFTRRRENLALVATADR